MVFVRTLAVGLAMTLCACGPRLAGPRTPTFGPVTPGIPASSSGASVDLGAGGDDFPSASERSRASRVPAESVLSVSQVSCEATYHEVTGGDSLASVAPQYGLDAETLRRANGLKEGTSLQPGQLLYVPTKKKSDD